MNFHQLGIVRTVATSAAAVALLSGCAAPVTPADSAGPTAVPTALPFSPTATAEPRPAPLLVISGTVADQDGQSLAITLTTTSVRAPSAQDLADYAATRCAAAHPGEDPFALADTRVITFAVDSVGSAGFAGWTDARGVRVVGSLFDGPIWESEAHGDTDCYQDSRIARPGSGEVRAIVSSADWNLPQPVVGDGAITLELYGFDAVSVDALGQPTGLTAVEDCVTTASAEFDTLATDVWNARWGRSQNLREYCFYGRGAGG